MSFNMGMPLFDKGFINVTVEKSFSDFTRHGGLRRPRLRRPPAGHPADHDGSIGLPAGRGAGDEELSQHQSDLGDRSADSRSPRASVKSGYDFSDNFSVYAFGTLSHKVGKG